MIGVAIVGAVIAAIEVMSHSEVVKLMDHELAEHVKHTHSRLKRFRTKIKSKLHKGKST